MAKAVSTPRQRRGGEHATVWTFYDYESRVGGPPELLGYMRHGDLVENLALSSGSAVRASAQSIDALAARLALSGLGRSGVHVLQRLADGTSIFHSVTDRIPAEFPTPTAFPFDYWEPTLTRATHVGAGAAGSRWASGAHTEGGRPRVFIDLVAFLPSAEVLGRALAPVQQNADPFRPEDTPDEWLRAHPERCCTRYRFRGEEYELAGVPTVPPGVLRSTDLWRALWPLEVHAVRAGRVMI